MSPTTYPGGVNAHPDRDTIDARIRAGEGGAAIARDYPELTATQIYDRAANVRKKDRRRAEGRAQIVPAASSPGAETPSPSPSHRAKFDKDGAGDLWFDNYDHVPSEAEIRAAMEHVGSNPDDFRWWVADIRWNSAGWKRDREDAKQPESVAHKNSSAYTGNTCSVHIKTEPIRPNDGPVVLERPAPSKVRIYKPRFAVTSSDWRTALMTPDAQIGYSKDRDGELHTIHDERAFDVVDQAACALRDDGGLFGWYDAGDLIDYARLSRFDRTEAHEGSELMNRAHERTDRRLAFYRAIVGAGGEVVVAGANHDRWLAWLKKLGLADLARLRRPGIEERYPVFSAPWWVNAEAHDVRWGSGYPNSYYALNSNLVVMHAPAMASQALGTARKIAERVHASVYFGHIHRRERVAMNTHDPEKGTRTFEIWSDGTLARTDGAVPGSGGEDNYGDPVLSSSGVTSGEGAIGPNWHQGFSVVRFERGGRERFEIQQYTIWDGWCSMGGQEIVARCDADGAEIAS